MVDGDRTMTPPHPDLDPAFMPAPVLLVGDTETLRAISDPTRMRLLETMVTRQEPAWSVKELATALAVPPTRLYHHIELLTERGLIRPVEQRVVSGIIETRYRVAARSFQLDRRLFAGDSDEAREILHGVLDAVFGQARTELEEAVAARAADLDKDAPVDRQVLLSRAIARLSPVRAEELRKRLNALEAEFGEDDGEDAAPYGFVIALYPIAPLPED
jgi:DNA-binding transcriptional ArsR family regulator